MDFDVVKMFVRLNSLTMRHKEHLQSLSINYNFRLAGFVAELGRGVSMHPSVEGHLARPNRRIMVFVDGENLVFRYEEMLRKGFVPREDQLFHEPGAVVWSPTFTRLAQYHENPGHAPGFFLPETLPPRD